MAKPKKLLEQVSDRIHIKQYSTKTEQAYLNWIKQYILFHDKKHPADLSAQDLENFLTYLATERNVAASTQNQALSAILFLYREVLDIPLETDFQFVGAKKPKRLPIVLSRDEVQSVLDRMTGTTKIIGQLLYGSGLRISEAIRLRVQNIDFAQGHILVRDGKGAQDRLTMLPTAVVEPLEETSCSRPGSAPTRPGKRLWARLSPQCACQKISPCRSRMDLAVHLPVEDYL